MKLLLDAQIIIWYVDKFAKLSSPALTAINDSANELFVSAATIWEIGIKVSINKLPLSLPYEQWMTESIHDMNLTILPITVAYSGIQASLPWHHRDPFDRLMIAQSMLDGIPIVSCDQQLDAYGIHRIW